MFTYRYSKFSDKNRFMWKFVLWTCHIRYCDDISYFNPDMYVYTMCILLMEVSKTLKTLLIKYVNKVLIT